ncbi:6952_t:CDS:10 [Racocetra fulgida]|uniref:6952_t:CDS:1 n=1 Tax=Racocetra fulgida TaxID=60492 RepID=A0A9N9GP84_9GLOM|nr:6952_t:CDS:10 [Racocetra fulgida]
MQSQQQNAPKLEIARRPKEPPTIGKIIEIESNFRKVKFDYPKIYSYTFEVSNQEQQVLENYKILFEVFNKLREDNEFDEKQYTASLKYSADIDFSPLKKFIEDENYHLLNSELLNLLRVLNIYLNFEARTKKNILTRGKGTFPIPERPKIVRRNLGLIHGFYQSVRIGWDQLLVNTDVCTAIYNNKWKKLVSLDNINPLVLREEMTKEMIIKSVIKPKERFDKIDKGIKEVYKHESDKGLRSIQFNIDNNNGFIKLKAMMINNTNVITEKGEWETIKFNKGADLYNWSVVCFAPEINESAIEPAIRQLKEILISKGLNLLDGRTKRLVNNLKSILSNVALKINGKLDGKNSRLADNLLDFKAERDDKLKGRPSVAAVCGSMDDTVTDYACRYRMNEKLRHDVDIIEKLNDMVIELLEQHEIKQTNLPDQIVFYRDGVGETQFDTVISEELEPLLDTLENHYKSKDLPTPKLTFIIIQKRHHASYAHNIANLARYFVEYKPIEESQENQGNQGGRGGRRGGRGGQGNRENLEGNRDDRRNRDDNNLRPPRPEYVQDGKTLIADSKIENEKFFL